VAQALPPEQAPLQTLQIATWHVQASPQSHAADQIGCLYSGAVKLDQKQTLVHLIGPSLGAIR